MTQAKTNAEATIIKMPDGTEHLTVRIWTDCPQCGKQEIHVLGHHLRAIRDFALEFVDRFPQLCGEAVLLDESDDTITGTPPKDPSVN